MIMSFMIDLGYLTIDLDEKINKFRNICVTINRYHKNKTKKGTRIRFFNTVAVPVQMYGDEARVMTERNKAKIQACLLYTSRCV